MRHVYIQPKTPHRNAKVERSRRVDDQEFYPFSTRTASPTDLLILVAREKIESRY